MANPPLSRLEAAGGNNGDDVKQLLDPVTRLRINSAPSDPPKTLHDVFESQ
jgi:hypothetical protein